MPRGQRSLAGAQQADTGTPVSSSPAGGAGKRHRAFAEPWHRQLPHARPTPPNTHRRPLKLPFAGVRSSLEIVRPLV